MMSDTATTTQVPQTEEQLIATALEAVFQSNWIVGECAAQWTQRYARGRTDADFAALVGLSADQVYQRRRVWEAFSERRNEFPQLKWSHYYAALTWDDAADCLSWAEETLSTVAEMRAWRRARRGEDLTLAGLDEAIQFLPTEPHAVQLPGAGGASVTGDRGPGSLEAAELRGSTAGVARDTGAEGDYTPFRTGATHPDSAKGSAEPPSTEQLTRRMTSALERFVKAMGRDFQQEFHKLPEKVRARFLRAAGDLQDAVGELE